MCSSNCNCTRGVVNPICGADGVVYMSPCVAGCRNELRVKNLKMYSDCSCVNATLTEVPGVSSDDVLLDGVQATRLRCPVACGLFLPYLIGVPIALSSVFLNLAPSTAASIR
nr:solute carrier organic anion transporter family member 4C1-like [Dermacentor andersoni]